MIKDRRKFKFEPGTWFICNNGRFAKVHDGCSDVTVYENGRSRFWAYDQEGYWSGEKPEGSYGRHLVAMFKDEAEKKRYERKTQLKVGSTYILNHGNSVKIVKKEYCEIQKEHKYYTSNDSWYWWDGIYGLFRMVPHPLHVKDKASDQVDSVDDKPKDLEIKVGDKIQYRNGEFGILIKDDKSGSPYETKPDDGDSTWWHTKRGRANSDDSEHARDIVKIITNETKSSKIELKVGQRYITNNGSVVHIVLVVPVVKNNKISFTGYFVEGPNANDETKHGPCGPDIKHGWSGSGKFWGDGENNPDYPLNIIADAHDLKVGDEVETIRGDKLTLSEYSNTDDGECRFMTSLGWYTKHGLFGGFEKKHDKEKHLKVLKPNAKIDAARLVLTGQIAAKPVSRLGELKLEVGKTYWTQGDSDNDPEEVELTSDYGDGTYSGYYQSETRYWRKSTGLAENYEDDDEIDFARHLVREAVPEPEWKHEPVALEVDKYYVLHTGQIMYCFKVYSDGCFGLRAVSKMKENGGECEISLGSTRTYQPDGRICVNKDKKSVRHVARVAVIVDTITDDDGDKVCVETEFKFRKIVEATIEGDILMSINAVSTKKIPDEDYGEVKKNVHLDDEIEDMFKPIFK